MKLYNPRQKSPKLAESLRVSSTIPAYDGLQKTHLHDTSTTLYNAHTPTTSYRLKTYTQHKKQPPSPTPPATTNHLRNTTQTLPQRHKKIATKALRNTHAADQHGYWPSRDPIEDVKSEKPELFSEGPNLYTFVGNNPIGRWDELGLCSWSCDLNFQKIASGADVGFGVNHPRAKDKYCQYKAKCCEFDCPNGAPTQDGEIINIPKGANECPAILYRGNII